MQLAAILVRTNTYPVVTAEVAATVARLLLAQCEVETLRLLIAATVLAKLPVAIAT